MFCQKKYFLKFDIGGDDGIVRLWDIASGDKVSEMPVHSDYIRAGECAPNDPNIFCSGGYDNQINVLDMRASEITMSFDHGQPIESICLFPSMSLIVSTGGRHLVINITER